MKSLLTGWECPICKKVHKRYAIPFKLGIMYREWLQRILDLIDRKEYRCGS